MKILAVSAAVASFALLAACGGGGGGEDPPAMTETPPPAGEVRVIDADTVEIGGVRYRLHGIDAPESRQTCRALGLTWDCGAAASEALASRAQGMSCAGSGTDRFGRTIGVCSSGGEDLNAWLVANGWALAYRQFSEDYLSREEQARSGRRGIHRGEFIEPWNWRRGERLDGEDTFAAIASDRLDADALAERMLRGDDANIYARWLDDSAFAIVDDAVAVSFGASPGTNPIRIGGGAWKGTMVGMDIRTRKRVEGHAVIEIDDFARPDVDVALIGIVDADGRARADFRWENLPVVQGAFKSQHEAGSIEGRFYGNDHGEVGGIFERDRLIGAFGASR